MSKTTDQLNERLHLLKGAQRELACMLIHERYKRQQLGELVTQLLRELGKQPGGDAIVHSIAQWVDAHPSEHYEQLAREHIQRSEAEAIVAVARESGAHIQIDQSLLGAVASVADKLSDCVLVSLDEQQSAEANRIQREQGDDAAREYLANIARGQYLDRTFGNGPGGPRRDGASS